MVKNKWALALCSVLTVIMSLLMSLGICLRCGFNPTLNGNYILPYLVVIIGRLFLMSLLLLLLSIDYIIISFLILFDILFRTGEYISYDKVCCLHSSTSWYKSKSSSRPESGGLVHNQESHDRNYSFNFWFFHFCAYHSGFKF